ncbi:hypothetical protein CXB51_025264 [Gossypium anomalum]|uniref:DUF4283 domain-containing protein n=1 Tax=Gossypium anomalum TaxID=47600 RepID=A0A8J6CUP5_9ROSI|nr:hypothetical protein CXB51_025264 [Gossypium anomalum]
MERELADLSLDDEEDEILQAQTNPDSVHMEIYLFLVGCFLTASVIHFSVMRNTMLTLWHPIKGVQISNLEEKIFLFKFFHKMDLERVQIHETCQLAKSRVFLGIFRRSTVPIWDRGHGDFFYQAKMALGFDVAEMGLDLSLVLAMSNVWLREYGEGLKKGNNFVDQDLGRRIDPILGVNLEGDLNLVSSLDGRSSKIYEQRDMEHDSEESVIEWGDGKKKA